MVEEISRLIRAVIPNVFETMFFVFFEPMEEGSSFTGGESPVAPEMWICSEIGFTGDDYAGCIKLFLPYEMSRRMAADFIGATDEPITEIQTRDMVGELANMIAGNLFSHYDKKERYTISVPQTELVPSPDVRPDGERMTFYFSCDEERIRADIEFARGAAKGQA